VVTDPLRGVVLDSNLPGSWVLGYSLWNLEFFAQYQPNEFFFFSLATIFIPLVTSALYRWDWLEVRAHTLMGCIIVRYGLTPKHRLSAVLWESQVFIDPLGSSRFFETDSFKALLAILSILAAVYSLIDAFRIFFLRRDAFPFFNFDVQHNHKTIAERWRQAMQEVSVKVEKTIEAIEVAADELISRSRRGSKAELELERTSSLNSVPSDEVATSPGAGDASPQSQAGASLSPPEK